MRTIATPWDRDRGMEHSAAIGAGRNPRFGGVAIVSPDFSVSARGKPISRDEPWKTKEFKECGAGTPPPLSLFQKISGPQFHEKHPKFARQTSSENRVARYVK